MPPRPPRDIPRPQPAARPAPPSPKRPRAGPALRTLRELRASAPPWSAACLCKVERPLEWKHRKRRLVVRLSDPTGSLEAAFSEAELARMLGVPPARVADLDRGATEKVVEAALASYSGVVALERVADDAALPPSQQKVRSMPAILGRAEPTAAQLREAMGT